MINNQKVLLEEVLAAVNAMSDRLCNNFEIIKNQLEKEDEIEYVNNLILATKPEFVKTLTYDTLREFLTRSDMNTINFYIVLFRVVLDKTVHSTIFPTANHLHNILLIITNKNIDENFDKLLIQSLISTQFDNVIYNAALLKRFLQRHEDFKPSDFFYIGENIECYIRTAEDFNLLESVMKKYIKKIASKSYYTIEFLFKVLDFLLSDDKSRDALDKIKKQLWKNLASFIDDCEKDYSASPLAAIVFKRPEIFKSMLNLLSSKDESTKIEFFAYFIFRSTVNLNNVFLEFLKKDEELTEIFKKIIAECEAGFNKLFKFPQNFRPFVGRSYGLELLGSLFENHKEDLRNFLLNNPDITKSIFRSKGSLLHYFYPQYDTFMFRGTYDECLNKLFCDEQQKQVRKVARVLGQAYRDPSSFEGKRLPLEILETIAVQVADKRYLEEKEALSIARVSMFKPSIEEDTPTSSKRNENSIGPFLYR